MELLTEFELYKSKIDNCINEFVDLLGGEYGRLENADTFNSLIVYIADRVFHNDGTVNNKANTNNRLSTTVDITNIALLNDLFNYYVFICGMYNHKPYIVQYCIFIDIESRTFERWSNGEELRNVERVSFCEKVHKVCEQAQVSADTVKSIFLLKSKYGYVETPQQINITTEIKQPTTDLISKYKDYPQLENQ